MLSFKNRKRKGLQPLRIKRSNLIFNRDAGAGADVGAGASELVVPVATVFRDDVNNTDDDEDDKICDDYDDDSDWSFSSTDSNTCADNESMKNAVVLQLTKEDIVVHLASELVARTSSTVKTMINRYSKLLVWFHIQIMAKGSAINSLELLKIIVLKRFQLLPKYYAYMRETLQLKPSTVYNFNEEVAVLFNWFAIFRVSTDEMYSVTTTDLYSVNLIIKAMRKMYSKERRLVACKSVNNTIEALIVERKWPQGGLKELHDAVLGQLSWARNVFAQNQSYIHDVTSYNNFLQVMLSSFYTGNTHN